MFSFAITLFIVKVLRSIMFSHCYLYSQNTLFCSYNVLSTVIKLPDAVLPSNDALFYYLLYTLYNNMSTPRPLLSTLLLIYTIIAILRSHYTFSSATICSILLYSKPLCSPWYYNTLSCYAPWPWCSPPLLLYSWVYSLRLVYCPADYSSAYVLSNTVLFRHLDLSCGLFLSCYTP